MKILIFHNLKFNFVLKQKYDNLSIKIHEMFMKNDITRLTTEMHGILIISVLLLHIYSCKPYPIFLLLIMHTFNTDLILYSLYSFGQSTDNKKITKDSFRIFLQAKIIVFVYLLVTGLDLVNKKKSPFLFIATQI